MTYADKLQDPRWQKIRLKILERDNWCCQLCGDTETTLHIHHKKYSGKNPWDASSEDLITYCKVCHLAIELLKSTHKIIRIKKATGSTGPKFLLGVAVKCNDTEEYKFLIYLYDLSNNILEEVANMCEATMMNIIGYFNKDKSS